MTIAVVGGGITGLAAARRLESLLPDADVVLLEQETRLGGKILTQRFDGFVVEGAPDSFLSRKERGVGLCEELGLAGELVGRRPENARTFVRIGHELHPLPSGLTGMIPADLDALTGSSLLSDEGRARLAAEADLPPAPAGGDESIAEFVTRRLGREAYERIVEPLMTGIYGGDGYELSLEATYPNLRALELENGSVLRGLLAHPTEEGGARPPFLTLRPGMDTLVSQLVGELARTELRVASPARAVRQRPEGGYMVELQDGETLQADGVVVATPAFATAGLLAELDCELAALHAEIPYASSAIVTLAYRLEDVGRPLDGYGYVVPRTEGSDVLACTWTSSKWEGRAPAGLALIRVYVGRFGQQDVTAELDAALLELARDEVRILDVFAEPVLHRVYRWPRGMPQYVLGHTGRVERIETALERHPGLALAGAAYRGVGIPDCIASGERAAESVARSLAGALR
ncbi:MAG TPA: protoporphyrinogen oxidase [Gaiellaceae bacterium]|nr:protoporphyrinogen oxidase [Gaiellaceae bacterium]